MKTTKSRLKRNIKCDKTRLVSCVIYSNAETNLVSTSSFRYKRKAKNCCRDKFNVSEQPRPNFFSNSRLLTIKLARKIKQFKCSKHIIDSAISSKTQPTSWNRYSVKVITKRGKGTFKMYSRKQVSREKNEAVDPYPQISTQGIYSKKQKNFPKIHRSVLRKITIDLLYFWDVFDVNLREKNVGRSTAYSCRTNVFI